MSFNTVSFKASSASIPAYRVVQLSAANTVQLCASLTAMPLGITVDTVLESGAGVPVQLDGIAKLYFNDSCAAGAQVGSNTLGMGIPFAAVTSTTYAIGILIGASVDKTGTIAEVLFKPVTR